MSLSAALLVWGLLPSANPEVGQVLAAIATGQGEARTHGIRRYVMGCKGKNKFAFRKNMDALEVLRPRFTDEDPAVRVAALDLTICYDKGTFEDAILALTEDRDLVVRERAYSEAAHGGTLGMATAMATQVERCGNRVAELVEDESKWCVFSLFALAENGTDLKDKALQARVADLAAPLLVAGDPKVRDHAMRALDLFGSSRHAAALKPVLDGDVTLGGKRVSPEEKTRARGIQKKLQKRK
jgi:hypothetical protein